MFISGMQLAWTSPTLIKLLAEDSPIKTTREEVSWLATFALASDIFGAPAGAIFASYFGRKAAILFTAIPYLVSWFLIAIASHIHVLMLARFIAGFADGSTFTIVPMYIGEIAEDKIRGKMGTLMTVFLDTGSLVMYAVGPFTSISDCGIIGMAFPVLLIVTFMWMPESPYYLLLRGKNDEAKKVLQQLRGTKDVEVEYNEAHQGVLEHSEVRFLDLFTVRSNFKALMIAFALRTFEMLSGIYAIMAYAELIFTQSGGSADLAYIGPIVFMTLKLITGIFSGSVVDKWGRVPITLISCLGTFFALLLQALFFYFQEYLNATLTTYVPITALSLYIIFYNIGLGTIPLIVSSEIFPTDVKPYALCLADLHLALVGSLVLKFYDIIAIEFGNYVPYCIFAGNCLVGVIFALTVMPETKGKSLEEIQDMLKNKKRVVRPIEEVGNTSRGESYFQKPMG